MKLTGTIQPHLRSGFSPSAPLAGPRCDASARRPAFPRLLTGVAPARTRSGVDVSGFWASCSKSFFLILLLANSTRFIVLNPHSWKQLAVDQPKLAGFGNFENRTLLRSTEAAHGPASHRESLASGISLRDQLRYQFESRHEPPSRSPE